MDRVIFQRSTLLLPEKQRTLPGERPLYHALRGPAACPQAAAAAHGVCELLDPLQGKGRQREGFEGNGHQLHGVVIPRHPVGAELAAPAAPVNHRPLLFFPHPHPDGVHDAAAVCGAVSRLLVHVEAAQAVGAVVAVVAPRGGGKDQPVADPAGKGIVAAMGFI